MRNFTLILLSALWLANLMPARSQSREILYQEDFESYAVGAKIAQSNPTRWTTWSNTPGSAEDGVISDEQASSPTKSLKISGTNDNVLKLGNKTAGKYKVNWKMFIPTTRAGYYNFQHFEAPGVEWAFEVYFDNNGTGYMHAGGNNAATFTFPMNTWFNVENEIDLDADNAKVKINGVQVHSWQFSLQAQGQAGTKQLGGINFYAGSTTGMTPIYYVDDLVYEAQTEQWLYQSNFDTYPNNGYVAQTIPEWFTTWSNTPGTAEDARFSNEQALSTPMSVKVAGTTDLIFKLGNKTSGKYLVEWDMFVPTSRAGYYNFQHFENPGVEWAFEVYFDNNGTGYMHAGGNNAATFTFPMNTWFKVVNEINLDADSAKVKINNVNVYAWRYSLQAQGQPGTKQLGGVNFYAGSTTGMTPQYYIDNIGYAELVAGVAGPTIQVSSAPIIISVAQGTQQTRNLPITNTGGQPLNVNIVASYDPPTEAGFNYLPQTDLPKAIGEFVEAPAPTNGGAPDNDTRATVILNYDGENNTGIGFTNGAQWRAAVRFPASMVAQYNGMMLTQLQIYINAPVNAHKIMVWDMGSITLPGPGQLVHEQAFNPLPGWNNVDLTTPVFITGRDLWVGYWMDQPAGEFPAGADNGPQHPDGAWVSSGPGWSLLTLPRNWNIRAKLEGDARPVWLSATPNQMAIQPGATTDVTVNINATNLPQLTVQRGKLHVRSNDQVTPQVNINVWITVLVGLNEKGEQTYVSMYPNPAQTYVNLSSNTIIRKVNVLNQVGQLVNTFTPDAPELRINTESMKQGVYILQIETDHGKSTQRLTVR
ncbi:MAG TPA: T9SS type A sorting domain-containing protein [Bacteroidales bacterium]|nr:T9SS type A sorting domain-containing protein [Bacteroidales bacterium]